MGQGTIIDGERTYFPPKNERNRNTEKERLRKRELDRRRRRAKRGAGSQKIHRYKVIESFGQTCYICLRPIEQDDLELDHVVPLCLGGKHRYDNVLPSHSFCNRFKGEKLLTGELRLEIVRAYLLLCNESEKVVN